MNPTPAKVREITSGTKEWADRNINCLKGCSNDCRYCYAKLIAKRFGRCTEETWKNIEINNSVVDKNFPKYQGRLMFPSTHDIIEPSEAKEACFTVIRKLLNAGNDILITTKPKLSITKDLVKQFPKFKTQMQFRFTITSLDNQLLSFWEPNAPIFEDRLDSLKYAYKKGFKTSVSIEPFLDYNPRELMMLVSPYITESLWLGPMNYIPANNIPKKDKEKYKQIRKRYEINHLKEIYYDLKDFPRIRFKDSMYHRLKRIGIYIR